MIAKEFVPLALNGDVGRQEMGARFLKRIANHFSNQTGIVTPNGDRLGNDMNAALKKWRGMSREDRARLDDLGKYEPSREPAPPEGGLVLKVYLRGLVRDGEALSIYRNPRAHLSKEAGRDHAWLTAAEWKSLVPAKARKDERAPVPEAITDRLCRRYLIDHVRIGGEGGPRNKNTVRTQKMTLTVAEVGDEVIHLRLDGSAAYMTFGPENGVTDRKGREDSFRIWGELEYDRKAGAFRRFDAVALCETGHFDEVGKKLVPLGVAFALTDAKTPADRVRPHSFHHDYYGKGK